MEVLSSSNIVTIKGNIKNISDLSDIRSVIEDVRVRFTSIVINIEDSISITSSVIGYLNKIVLKDGIGLEMNIGSKQLLELLSELNLAKTFNIRPI
jgi:hypothetical protein